MARREWPLVIFTLLGQTAVGAFWLTAVPLAFTDPGAAPEGGMSLGFAVFGGIAGLLGIAAAASFFHLGRPWRAVYAINNLKTSWLSREILSEVVFLSLAAGLASLEWIRPGCTSRSVLLQGVVLIAGLSGLFFLYGMIRVYMLKTIPVWRGPYTPASFVVTTLLLGGLACAAFMNGLPMPGWNRGVPSFSHLVPVALAAAAAGLAVTIFLTPRVGVFGSKAVTLLAPGSGEIIPFLIIRGLLLAASGAAVLLIWIRWKSVPAEAVGPIVWWALAAGLAAEGIGRWQFYALYGRIGV